MTRSAVPTAIISAMEARGPKVTIEFDLGVSERIAGLLVNDQGKRIRFDGWLGLASALEQVLGGSRRIPVSDAGNGET